MTLQSWGDVLAQTFQDLWLQVATFAPKFILSILFFVLGWVIGSVVGGIIQQAVRGLQIEKMLRNMGIEDAVEKSGYRLDIGKLLGTLVRWFIVIVFLVVALNVVGLSDVNVFLQTVVLGYLPRVVVAVLVLLLSAVIGDAARSVVLGAGRATENSSAAFAANTARWSIWIFGLLIALHQLGVADELIQTLWNGIIAMVALAGGLAFGLGGRDAAAKTIDRMQKELWSNK